MGSLRFWGILSLVGGLTAIPLLVAFSVTGWGAPGTAVYQTYELLNRLMAAGLLLMAAGWVGVWRALAGYGRWAASLALGGVLIMAAGTAAEFWLFTALPYAGENGRQAAFTAASIGGLLLSMGATGVGLSIWRSRFWPRWSAVILLLALPLDIIAFFLLGSPFVTAAVFALILGRLQL